MRTIVIGDLHGCLVEFRELIQKLGYQRGVDRLVCLGDFMDRGPESAGCVKYARELGAEAVRGNHEEKWLRWFKHEAKRAEDPRYQNPMRGFSLEKATQGEALSEDDRKWLRDLPDYLDLGDGLLAVHAGFQPGVALHRQDSNTMNRIRFVDANGKFIGYKNGTLDQPSDTVYWTEQWQGPQSVVYGHAVHSLTDVRIDSFSGGKCFGIDTGCCFGGRLTAMVAVPGKEHEFVQVQAHQVYFAKHKEHSDA